MSTGGIVPGVVLTVIITRASTDSDRCALKSALPPLNAWTSIACHFSLCSVVAQVQHACRRPQQLVLARLEQFVARESAKDVDQRFASVASRSEPGTRHDVRCLAPEQRYVGGVCAVRSRCEEAEETILTAYFAARVETLDRHVVEVAWTMDGRARC